MKSLNRALLVTLLVLPLVSAVPGRAQTSTAKQAAASTDTPEKNIQAYIDLMRADVRQQKSELLGAVMLLSATDAAIYNDYDAALTKLNDQRVANIREYARTYNKMTDQKADELIRNAMAYQRQRAELLAKTYERVKNAVGAPTAARFVQVENQLLELIDLQIASSLPVVGTGS